MPSTSIGPNKIMVLSSMCEVWLNPDNIDRPRINLSVEDQQIMSAIHSSNLLKVVLLFHILFFLYMYVFYFFKRVCGGMG